MIDWTDRRVHELWCKRDEPVLPYSSDRIAAYMLLEQICDEYLWGFFVRRRYCNRAKALIVSVQVESMPSDGELFGARFALEEAQSYQELKWRFETFDLTAVTICRLLIGVAEKKEEMGVFEDDITGQDRMEFPRRREPFPGSRQALRRQDQRGSSQ